MNMEDMNKLSLESPSMMTPPPPPPSFTSLPYDIVVNILARVSRYLRPTLSLVSKGFLSITTSPELEATRTRMGIPEDYLYVCLDLYKNQWFQLQRIPQREKLLPILGSVQHPESSTIVSMSSDMYLIGGLVDKTESKRVLVLDCLSREWRSLPDMIVPRHRPAAEVINGKIYVVGGCKEDYSIKHWGEVYDSKTSTWEPLTPASLDLTSRMNMVPNRLVMGGKMYDMNSLTLKEYICLVEIETNIWCEMYISGGELLWRDANSDSKWGYVYGLEKLFATKLVSVANSSRGRVTVWWTTVQYGRQSRRYPYNRECKTDIWCAEISFKRLGGRELISSIEWSNSVLTFEGDGSGYWSRFLLHSAIVTHT